MFILLVIPSFFLVTYLFNDMEETERENLVTSAEFDLNNIVSFAEQNRNAALSILEIVDDDYTISELLEIEYDYRYFISNYYTLTEQLESLVSVNTTTNNLRIYVDDEQIPESFPLFIDRSRVFYDDWFLDSGYNSSLRVHYKEDFSEVSYGANIELISFNKVIAYSNQGKNVAEVSFSFEDFFGDTYSNSTETLIFVEYAGDLYPNIPLSAEEISYYKGMFFNQAQFNEPNMISMYDGTEYLVSNKSSDSMGFNYYLVNDLSAQFSELRNTQFLLLSIIFALVMILIVLFEYITKVMLRRIYETFDVMHNLEKNPNFVKVENISPDEVGKFQVYFNTMVDKINYYVKEEAKRAVIEKEMELKALQSQINSHFLYNVLNNIEMMAIVDNNEMIADTVTALARLLRYSMNWKTQTVTLLRELEYIEDYVSLFNMRFDNSINLIFDIDDECKLAVIPKMSIQPVVENSIKHGIESITEDALVRISAHCEDNCLVIGITDTGCGIEEKMLNRIISEIKSNTSHQGVTGIGLHNVQERIDTRYGEGYGLDIQSKVDHYTKITIKIPYILVKEKNVEEGNNEKRFDSWWWKIC